MRQDKPHAVRHAPLTKHVRSPTSWLGQPSKRTPSVLAASLGGSGDVPPGAKRPNVDSTDHTTSGAEQKPTANETSSTARPDNVT